MIEISVISGEFYIWSAEGMHILEYALCTSNQKKDSILLPIFQ